MIDSWNPAVLNDAIKSGQAGGGSSSSYDISETESKTNYSYNNKDVYCKEISFGAKSFSTGSALALLTSFEMDFDVIINAKMITIDTGNATFTSSPTCWPDTTNKILYIAPDYTSSVVEGKIMLYYTK